MVVGMIILPLCLTQSLSFSNTTRLVKEPAPLDFSISCLKGLFLKQILHSIIQAVLPTPLFPLSTVYSVWQVPVSLSHMGAHGWVARICQPWEQSPSRSWLQCLHRFWSSQLKLQSSQCFQIEHKFKLCLKLSYKRKKNHFLWFCLTKVATLETWIASKNTSLNIIRSWMPQASILHLAMPLLTMVSKDID